MVLDDPVAYLSRPGEGRAQFATDDRNEMISRQCVNTRHSRDVRKKLDKA